MAATPASAEPAESAHEPSASPRAKRRFLPRFGLRALFVVAVLFCLFFGWIGRNLYLIRQEEAAVETLKRAGATVMVRTELRIENPSTGSAEPWYFPDDIDNADDYRSTMGRLFGFDPHPVTHVFLPHRPNGPHAAALTALARFPELENVRISGSDLDDEALASLAELPKLNDLTISGTSITGEGLATLSRCPALERLILGEPDDAHIVSGVPSLPHLKTLYLYLMHASREDLEAAAAHPTLDSLHVSIGKLPDENVFAPLEEATSLREFALTVGPKSRPLTDAEARSIVRTPNLRILLLTRFDTALLDPLLEIESLRILGIHGDWDDFAAGLDFSRKRPGCLVKCTGTPGLAYFLAGEELDRDEGEELLRELERR